MTDSSSSTRPPWRHIGLLSGMLAVRMLGLFMVLPVLALYAETLAGATPVLIGLAVGVSGITQATLQIPFGTASDRYGRKPVIVAGLLIFAAGSMLAAVGETVWVVIAGRALQGAGAISAAAIALIADLTPSRYQTRAMAVVGISIGAAFALSMVLGPALAGHIGVPGLFWLTALLAGLAALAALLLPPGNGGISRTPSHGLALALLREPDFRRLSMGIFTLHLLLTATFVALPGLLRDQAGLPPARHWELYLPALLFSLALTLPLIKWFEQGQAYRRRVFAAAVALLGAGQLVLAFEPAGLVFVGLAVVLFFGGFNFLEANLPALVAASVPESRRGAALGVYAASQFLGAFAGGLLGGWLLGLFGAGGVFAAGAGLALLWLGFARRS